MGDASESRTGTAPQKARTATQLMALIEPVAMRLTPPILLLVLMSAIAWPVVAKAGTIGSTGWGDSATGFSASVLHGDVTGAAAHIATSPTNPNWVFSIGMDEFVDVPTGYDVVSVSVEAQHLTPFPRGPVVKFTVNTYDCCSPYNPGNITKNVVVRTGSGIHNAFVDQFTLILQFSAGNDKTITSLVVNVEGVHCIPAGDGPAVCPNPPAETRTLVIQAIPGGVPTVSGWGAIVLSLLLAISMTVMLRRRSAFLVDGPAPASAKQFEDLFDAVVFTKSAFGVSLLLCALAAATMIQHGALSRVDVVGSLISGFLLAYVIHLWTDDH